MSEETDYFNDRQLGQWAAVSPDTSRVAAIQQYFKVGKQRHIALMLIAEMGSHGRTADEVEVIMGVPHQSASARVNELHDPKVRQRSSEGVMEVVHVSPFVRATGDKRRTRWGRDADIYVVTEEGTRVLAALRAQQEQERERERARTAA